MSMQKGLTADSAIALVQRYLAKEKLHWQPSKYAVQGDEVTSVQRNDTVKWLTVISRHLKFSPETLFLTITLLDDFLRLVRVSMSAYNTGVPEKMTLIIPIVFWLTKSGGDSSVRSRPFSRGNGYLQCFLRLVRARSKYLKCIAISCFYLASKVIEEDEMVPHIKDLITNSNCNFSVSEITRMEAVILKKLKWDLCRATALDFLHGFHALLVLNRNLFLPDQSGEQLAALGPLLETKLQICLDKSSLLATRPSTIALALVSLELEHWTGHWFVITTALQRLAQVENSDVIRCREELASIFTKARTAMSRKHRHSDSQNSPKPSKRKMENMDIEEIYDSLKKLYGDETTTVGSCCGMHQGHSIDMAGFPVRAM